MIPQKIQIKNFLSYGPIVQEINFVPYNLICLSGKNGHGKSALLDAMTWALWGQARKIAGTTKADQGLLRLGQTQMIVIFDFEFNGKSYRIRREYMETYGKPIAVLEFGMIDTETDTFIPLTDKTIRTTQEKIEQTLRLDFDSFSNSAFLRQGSSNEFSKKSPKDRKQILATILGLDQYEIIRKCAIEKIKAAQTKKTMLTTLQDKRQQELTQQETLDAQLATLNQNLTQIIQQEQQLINENMTHLHNRALYDEQQKKYHNFSFHLKQLSINKETQQKQLRETLMQWRVINKKKQSLHSIYQLKEEKNQIIATITDHQKLFQQNLEHKETILNLTQQINTIEQQHKDEQTKKNHGLLLELERLLLEQKNREKLITTHEEQIKQHTTEKDNLTTLITAHRTELARISINADEVTHLEAHLEKRKAAYHSFVSLGNWINNELNSLCNKKKLVHENDSSCPLCEQNLSAARRRFLKQNFEQQESFLTHRLRRLKRIIPALKEILIKQHEQLVQKKELIQHCTTLTAKIEELNAAHTKLEQQISQIINLIAQLRTEIASYNHIITTKQQQITQLHNINELATNTQYIELVHHKNCLEETLKKHPYNEHSYKEAQQQLKLIEQQLSEYETVQKDVAQQENRKNDIKKLCINLKNINIDIANLQQQQAALGDLTVQLQKLQEHEKNLEYQQTQIKTNKEVLLHTKGSIENQHKHLTQVKNEFEQERVHIITLDTLIDDYSAIATATGKDGIQALLIEDAIPEIEQEANHILSRLTNNQAQIFIESLRDLKKGGTKETLDIKISDQVGIRPYEMFSGGEAFRIDFALRIAISKLLARRAGTALQTLIIDEGFGSQDEEGLGHIMDALHKIQDDFSKIIIVSHLPAMKDQFPVQFFIEKGVQGSTIHVIEQG